MAVEVEQRIMATIGLGQHYHWYNGSGSCRGIAVDAAMRLPRALIDCDATADPDPALMRLVGAVAAAESMYSLTATWQVCSDVIQAHWHRAGGMSDEDWDRLCASITERYEPKPVPDIYGGERWPIR